MFEVYVYSYTEVSGRVATATVTFKAECYEVQDAITNDLSPTIDYWTWDTTDKDFFMTGY